MWVLEACFEGTAEPFRKLLKPGQRYSFGRKPPAELVFEDKTVSRDAGHIDVGPWEPPPLQVQVATGTGSAYLSNQATRRPYVRLHAGKKLVRVIGSTEVQAWERDKTSFIGRALQPETDHELDDGDVIVLTRSCPAATLVWQPLAFCVAAKGVAEGDFQAMARELAFLSIPMVMSRRFVSGCTHLVTGSASPTTQILEALIAAAPLVTSAYVDVLVKRGNLNLSEPGSLQAKLDLPDEAEYFPEQATVEGMTVEEVKEAFAPKPERKMLLEGTTFLVATRNEMVDRAIDKSTHVLEAAGATIDRCPASILDKHADEASALRLLKSKKEAARGSLVVLSAPATDIDEPWYEAFVRASRKLDIPMPKGGIVAVNKALLSANTTGLLDQPAPLTQDDISAGSPSVEQGSGPGQGAQARPATPSPPTAQSGGPSGAPTPSNRKLKRRAGQDHTNPFEDILGANSTDSRTTSRSEAQNKATAGEAGSVEPTQSLQSTSRRRRNVIGDVKEPRRSEVWRNMIGNGEADNGSSATTGEYNGAPASTLVPMTGATQRYSKKFRKELEEADQRSTQRKQQLQQQQQSRVAGADEEMNIDTDEDTTLRPMPQQRDEGNGHSQMKEGNGMQSETRRKHGQEAGSISRSCSREQGDKVSPSTFHEQPASTSNAASSDCKFLQSVASMKRGAKKKVSDFDTEFDRLRLSHHGGRSAQSQMDNDDFVEDPEYQAWNEMGEDDFDVQAAGNFVQVDFVPLLRRRPLDVSGEISQSAPAGSMRADESGLSSKYAGRPNFKKFKTKERSKRVPVALDLPEAVDYGIGPGYRQAASARGITIGSHLLANREHVDDEEDGFVEGPLSLRSAGTRPTQTKRSIFDRTPDKGDVGTLPRPTSSSRSDSTKDGPLQGSKSRTGTQTSQSTAADIAAAGEGSTSREIDLRLDVDAEDLDESFQQPRPRPGPSSGSTQRLGGAAGAQRRGPGLPQPGAAAGSQTSQRLVPRKRATRAGTTNDDDSSCDEGFSFKGFKRAR